MPTYVYRCRNCGNELEAVQKFSDAPLTVCPECEGELRKVFSPVGVVFKGSGFYRTDSRTSGNDSSSGGKPGEKKPGEKKSGADAGSGSTTGSSSSSSDGSSGGKAGTSGAGASSGSSGSKGSSGSSTGGTTAT